MRTTFREVSLPGVKRFLCACGRRLTRHKRFFQTVNPFNKTADGRIKDGNDIMAELRAEYSAWLLKTEPCTHKEKPR